MFFLSSSRTTLALTAPVVSRCATCTRFPTPVSSCRPRWTVRARRRRSAWVSSSSTTCTGSRRPATPTSCCSRGRPATWPRPRPVTWPRQPSTPALFTMATAASSPTPYSTAIWVRTAATDRAPHLCFIACPRRPTPRWDTLSGRQAPSSVPPPPRIRPAPCPPPTHRWTWAQTMNYAGAGGGAHSLTSPQFGSYSGVSPGGAEPAATGQSSGAYTGGAVPRTPLTTVLSHQAGQYARRSAGPPPDHTPGSTTAGGSEGLRHAWLCSETVDGGAREGQRCGGAACDVPRSRPQSSDWTCCRTNTTTNRNKWVRQILSLCLYIIILNVFILTLNNIQGCTNWFTWNM